MASKSEGVRFVPNGDRFDEGSGRKIAVPDGSHARSFDGGAGRAGDSEIEEPVLGRGKFGKGNHVGQTFSGGACTITSDRTAKSGASGRAFFSKPIRRKVAAKTASDGLWRRVRF